MSEIGSQVRLPLRVALDVALQGIRIRLGRSFITLMGIALGIAFLMSILTGQAVRESVKYETTARAEVQRMISFLSADTGPVKGRILGVVQVGALNELEERLARRLLDDGVQRLNWSTLPGAEAGPQTAEAQVHDTDVDHVGDEASAILVLGDAALPDMPWDALLGKARQRVLALTRTRHGAPEVSEGIVLPLERDLKPEEIAEREQDARRNRFRTVWIIIISLLVTVIGITNAMLMSVTERFREIGTMKCLGALSRFVRQLFFMESLLMGVVGSTLGSVFGAAFAIFFFGLTYGMGLVLGSIGFGQLAVYLLFSVVAGVVLAVVAAIYPAGFAARMVPAAALRSNV